MNITSTNGAKILIGGDSSSICKLRKALDIESYDISDTSSLQSVFELTLSLLPDLILLDIPDNEVDVFEICRRIKADDMLCNIPLVFVVPKNKNIASVFAFDRVDCITQPFHNDELRALVQTHLRIKALTSYEEKLLNRLRTQNKKLRELNDLKNKFLGMAAHDLRNPLSGIIGFSQMLLDDEGEIPKKEREEFLQFINSLSKDMLSMVEDLLDISVIESGKLEIEAKQNSLRELLDERIRISMLIAEKKNITIHSSFLDVFDAYFDLNKISQVVDNLLSNAIKFSPYNSNIYITMEIDGGMAKVCVRDEGPGISKDDQSKLCGEFQKLTAKPTAGESSTGLGLAIVRKIVDAHGGSFTVDSTLGMGTTFCLTVSL